MRKANLLSWSFALFALLAVLSFNACGDEEPVLDRDKFIGEYLGNLVCPGTLSAISADSVTFEIDVSADLNSTESVIVFLPVDGLPAPLDVSASVSGNTITFMDFKENVPIPQFPNFFGDINVSGTGTLVGSEISGLMSLEIFITGTEDLIGMDECTITGTKL